MYVILWEFCVRPGCEKEFESAYRPEGEWAEFFRRGVGYLGTQLLRDVGVKRRYVTIDTWNSQADYLSFRRKWREEYQAIDRKFESLTEHEAPLGSFLSLDPVERQMR